MCTEMDSKDKLIEELQKKTAELESVIKHQNELIAQLRHQLFGSPSEKSRRINPDKNQNKPPDSSKSETGSNSKKKE